MSQLEWLKTVRGKRLTIKSCGDMGASSIFILVLAVIVSFSITEKPIDEAFESIFVEFLKRLTDRVVEVRMLVLEHIKSCLLSFPSRSESPQIYVALCDRLLDYDENVRKQVVVVICDVACMILTLFLLNV